MVARGKDSEDFARGKNGGDWVKTAGERLADDGYVGNNAVVLEGEEFSGAAEARLDLVGHQQDIVLAADSCGLREEAIGRNLDAASPWMGSMRKGAGVGRDGSTESFRIAEGDLAEAAGGTDQSRCGYWGSDEKPTIAMVRPWKLLPQTMISA